MMQIASLEGILFHSLHQDMTASSALVHLSLDTSHLALQGSRRERANTATASRQHIDDARIKCEKT
jgi:hypothetical protein